jgi:hypothetical protein
VCNLTVFHDIQTKVSGYLAADSAAVCVIRIKGSLLRAKYHRELTIIENVWREAT